MSIFISEDHVGLVLLSDGDSSFYLEIPLDSVDANCLDAARYLLFVGWCIMGVEGVLPLEPDGQEHDLVGEIVEQAIMSDMKVCFAVNVVMHLVVHLRSI